nr:MAG TPA: protein of unknown function (DUF4969) [Crassvirales sp.]
MISYNRGVEKLSIPLLFNLIYLIMKKLFVFAFAIIALCSSCGNGCSRTTDSVDSTSVDTCITVDSAKVDTVNSVDSTSFSMVCPD